MSGPQIHNLIFSGTLISPPHCVDSTLPSAVGRRCSLPFYLYRVERNAKKKTPLSYFIISSIITFFYLEDSTKRNYNSRRPSLSCVAALYPCHLHLGHHMVQFPVSKWAAHSKQACVGGLPRSSFVMAMLMLRVCYAFGNITLKTESSLFI